MGGAPREAKSSDEQAAEQQIWAPVCTLVRAARSAGARYATEGYCHEARRLLREIEPVEPGASGLLAMIDRVSFSR